MKKIICLFLPFLVILFFMLWSWNFSPNMFIHESSLSQELWRDVSLRQTFINQYPLKGIKLKFFKINSFNHGLNTSIYELDDFGKPVQTFSQKIPSQEVLANTWQNIYLPQALQKDKKLAIELRGETASGSGSLAAFLSNMDNYPNGDLVVEIPQNIDYHNIKNQAKELVFRPIYQASGWQITKYYINRIAFAKPLSKIFYLAVFLSMIYFGLLLILRILIKIKSRQELSNFIMLCLILIISFVIIFYQTIPSFYLNYAN